MGKTLTPELIRQRCKTDKLQNVKNLNLWGNDLDDISILKDMPNIEICSLSLNKIASLKFFQTCDKMTELYLRKNAVSDLLEIKHLAHCPALKVLWLWDNPISEHPFYRPFIIKTLPNLVKLDNDAVTSDERVEAAQRTFSDKDILSQQPDAKPQMGKVSHPPPTAHRATTTTRHPPARPTQPRSTAPRATRGPKRPSTTRAPSATRTCSPPSWLCSRSWTRAAWCW